MPITQSPCQGARNSFPPSFLAAIVPGNKNDLICDRTSWELFAKKSRLLVFFFHFALEWKTLDWEEHGEVGTWNTEPSNTQKLTTATASIRQGESGWYFHQIFVSRQPRVGSKHLIKVTNQLKKTLCWLWKLLSLGAKHHHLPTYLIIYC